MVYPTTYNVIGNCVANTTTGVDQDYEFHKEFQYTKIIREDLNGKKQIAYINQDKLWKHAHLLQETDPEILKLFERQSKLSYPDCEHITFKD